MDLKTKCCGKCNILKSLNDFYQDLGKSDGYQTICKNCVKLRSKNTYHSKPIKEDRSEYFKKYNSIYYDKNKNKMIAKANKRRADQLMATPKWADLNKINEIYQNKPDGYHVDHILPLKGKYVCGLHVETNLQYLPAKENIRKSNKVIS